MNRCVDCGGVILSVDGCRFPSAATAAAETPAAATTDGVGQFSGAARAGTFADLDSSQRSSSVEHAFAILLQEPQSASLQLEAEVG